MGVPSGHGDYEIDFWEDGNFWQSNSITFPEFINEGRDTGGRSSKDN